MVLSQVYENSSPVPKSFLLQAKGLPSYKSPRDMVSGSLSNHRAVTMPSANFAWLPRGSELGHYLTLPSPVMAPNQLLVLLCFVFIELAMLLANKHKLYRLTQRQKQPKGLYPLHLRLPVAPTTALGNGWVLRNCL